MGAADVSGGVTPAAPGGAVSSRERRELVRRTDWRFLLPTPPSGGFEHLLLLGGPAGLADVVREMGIADRVSTDVVSGRGADVAVLLSDAPARLREAAAALAAGGVLYAEIDRNRPAARRMTPQRIARVLRESGLASIDSYWVRDSFRDRRVYLPLGLPEAVAWYFTSVHHSHPATLRKRAAVACFRLAAALGTGMLDRAARCFVIVAARAEVGGRAPSVLGLPGLPASLARPGLRPVLIAPRLRRAIFIACAPGEPWPLAVLKVSRFPGDAEQTTNEQRLLTTLTRGLDDRLRATIPAPLGVYRWGELTVGVESCIRGRLLACAHSPFRQLAARARCEELESLAGWLADLHSQSTVCRTAWDGADTARVARSLARYEAVFGLTGDERRLFADVRDAARALESLPLPRVWCHGDLNTKNAYRTARGVGVVDWEQGGQGLPLFDLLFFAEEWLHQSAEPRPDREGRIRRFSRVFVEMDASDPATAGIHRVIQDYMTRLDLAAEFWVVLEVLLWVEAALWRYEHAQELNQDEIARDIEARYRGYVRALAGDTLHRSVAHSSTMATRTGRLHD